MQKTIVITGANGFIGRNLCRKLAKDAWRVHALVLRGTPIECLKGIQNLKIVETDFVDMDEMASMLPDKPDVVFHLAWAGVAPEVRNDFDVQMSNISLSERVLMLAVRLHAKKFILPGSTLEYSMGGRIITSAGNVPTPQNAYARAKIAARYICECLAAKYGMPFIYTIFAGCYGAERRDNNVVFYTIDSLLRGVSPKLTGLKQLWDYVHIDDLVAGISAICDKGVPGKTYPVGKGDNIPLRQYVEIIHEIIDPSIPLGIGALPYPNGQLPMSCVDITELTKDTGFVPKVDFRAGIAEVVDRYKEETHGK